jgi:hypothetical protein
MSGKMYLTKNELLKILEPVDDDAPIEICILLDSDHSVDAFIEVVCSLTMCPGMPGCTHVGPAPDHNVWIYAYPIEKLKVTLGDDTP